MLIHPPPPQKKKIFHHCTYLSLALLDVTQNSILKVTGTLHLSETPSTFWPYINTHTKQVKYSREISHGTISNPVYQPKTHWCLLSWLLNIIPICPINLSPLSWKFNRPSNASPNPLHKTCYLPPILDGMQATLIQASNKMGGNNNAKLWLWDATLLSQSGFPTHSS